jgi:surface antigen
MALMEIEFNTPSFANFRRNVAIEPATRADRIKQPAVQEVAGQNQLTPEVAQAQVTAANFAKKIARIPSLESVYVAEEEDGFAVYVVGNNISEEDERALVDAEWMFALDMPDAGIDLRWLDRHEQPLASVINPDRYQGVVRLVDLRERKNA